MKRTLSFALAVPATASLMLLAAPALQAEPGDRNAVTMDHATVSASRIDAAPSAIVRHADLNLDSVEGMKTLNARIDLAVDRVCEAVPIRDLPAKPYERDCRATAYRSAMEQVDALIAERKLAARRD